jgi:DNA-binding NarL/FixJ family response regulator
MSDEIAVLLVDDQELFREGVRVIIDAQDGMRVVLSARTLRSPDLVFG